MSPHAGQAARQAHKLVGSLEPLPAEKHPGVALLLGIFFGALGVGIYFRSWKDFFICLFLFIFLTLAIPAVGSIPGWLFAGFYGAYRAHSSNERRRGSS
jgi:hypothetical protein